MLLLFLLSRNHHSLVVLVPQPESWSSRSELVLAFKIGPWSWIFFHIALHPLRKLLLFAIAKAHPF